MAGAMSRHVSDLDSYYIGRWAGRGSRHNVQHWGDMDKEFRISQPGGKKFAYYILGDRSVLDIVEVMHQVIRSYGDKTVSMGMSANLPALLQALLTKWETTGDPKLREVLERIASGMADSIGEQPAPLPDTYSVNFQTGEVKAASRKGVAMKMMTGFGGVPTLMDLAESLPSPRLRAALVKVAQFQMLPLEQRKAREEDGVLAHPHQLVFRIADLLGYAYASTGDESFREFAMQWADVPPVEIRQQPVTRYGQPSAESMPVPHNVLDAALKDQINEEVRKYYTLFDSDSLGQCFCISYHLRTLPILLGALRENQPSK
jgi:hypothetical protein